MNRVIITGVSSGLGFELAKIFQENSYEVIGISRTKPELNIIHIGTDLTDKDSIEKTTHIIKEKYSNFKVLINCAGVLNIEKLGEVEYDKLEKLFKTNVIAPIILTSGLIENIKSNESDIVNVGSTVGFKAYESQLAYGSSKWAVRGINENLQLELKKTKCRVIGFNPGGFQSNIFEKATGIKNDLSGFMNPKDLAKLLFSLLELPKNIEVSEIIINRK